MYSGFISHILCWLECFLSMFVIDYKKKKAEIHDMNRNHLNIWFTL